MFSRGLDRRLDGIGLPPETRKAIEDQKEKLVAIGVPESQEQVRSAIDESFLDGFRAVMLAAAGLALLASASAAWLISSPHREKESGGT